MARPTSVQIDTTAILHNLNHIKQCAPDSKVIAMVKANAYGCGVPTVASTLEGHVDAFGVACLEEAMTIRTLGIRTDCILFQGVFSADELPIAAAQQFQCVLHQSHQLEWLLANPLTQKIKVWVKINTGMHRLGFAPEETYNLLAKLKNCPWVDDEIGLMTHLACADIPDHPNNQNQLKVFNALNLPDIPLIKSMSNSAAILALPAMHMDVVRPGIMLYGVSPFANKTGLDLGLKPVMRFVSAISAIHHYPAQAHVGYGATWRTSRPSVIGVVAVGYGDGYPRHIAQNTLVWINGYEVPIVGRVSMDTLTVDLTDIPAVNIGDLVELWGSHIPVEQVALAAGTIAYELLCHFSPRARQDKFF